MDKTVELMETRARLWDRAKRFLDERRDASGLLNADDNAAYERMEADLMALGREIDRQERLDAIGRRMAMPTTEPIVQKPGRMEDGMKEGRASDGYRTSFWDMMRSRTMGREVVDALKVGTDSEGGYLVPDEFEHTIVEAIEEENVFRTLADDSGMLRAIIRPALIETNGRFYAELPSSIVSWTQGESSAAAVYESDYILIDLIQSDNGLLVQEYIENSMRFRELSLNPSTGEISELKTTSGRMFDYICGRSVFSDDGKRVSTHILGDATADDMRVELMAVADGLAYSVTVAGIDNIGEWLSSVIYSGSLTRYLHIFSLYNELYTIVNGGYDAMNETGRAIGVPDAEIEESAFIISDSAVVTSGRRMMR